MNGEETLGCLGLGIEDTDYILCEGDIDDLPKLYNQDNVRFEYNQANQSRSKSSCTIFSAMGMLSDLMNYEFSLAELKEVDELSYEHGRIRGQGRYVKSAVDLVAKWWNEKHADLGKVAYYRINKYSDIDEIIQKGYTINGNFCPTTSYSADYRKDAVLDGCEFGFNTNGHATDIIFDGVRKVKDSYKGRKTYDGTKECNRYELKHKVAELTNYGSRFYVYTKVSEDNLEEIKRLNELKSLVLIAIETNSKMRHLTQSKEYQERLHLENERKRNERLAYINEKLKSLS